MTGPTSDITLPNQVNEIDGPSGSGKGTLAAKIAAHYQFHLLDSGALYRLLGLSLHQQDLLDALSSELSQCVEIAKHLDTLTQFA